MCTIYITHLQWNPDFLNPQFLESPNNLSQTLFFLNLLLSVKYYNLTWADFSNSWFFFNQIKGLRIEVPLYILHVYTTCLVPGNIQTSPTECFLVEPPHPSGSSSLASYSKHFGFWDSHPPPMKIPTIFCGVGNIFCNHTDDKSHTHHIRYSLAKNKPKI